MNTFQDRIQVVLAQRANMGFRDPCAYVKDGVCHLYYTLVSEEADGQYFYLAESVSTDLQNFSEPRILTPRDKNLEYSSPGNVFFREGQYHMCMQTYPRPEGEVFGNQDSRIFLMHSPDLENWSEPELIRVKGDIPREEMGRMIDPYILEEENGELICFFKQNGVSYSRSRDMEHWSFIGSTGCGENVSVVKRNGWTCILHSPKTGVGLLLTKDLEHFIDCGVNTFGAENYAWAKDRVTAGFALEHEGETILFFHGDNEEDYVFGASIALIRNFDLTEAYPAAAEYLSGQ